MAMKKIQNIFSNDPRFQRLQKPFEAAEICETARLVSNGRYNIVSFKDGLLTASCSSTYEASNLQSEIAQIISSINKKIGEEKVKRVRFRINRN